MSTISKNSFTEVRRQKFLDEQFANAYLTFYKKETARLEQSLYIPEQTPDNRVRLMRIIADNRYEMWAVEYTAGQSISKLRNEFSDIVNAYTRAAKHERDLENEPALPWFDFKHIDDYARVVALLSIAILAHREDLIIPIASLFKDGAPDKSDALIEDMLGKYLPNRPYLETSYHEIPYSYLLDATVGEDIKQKQGDIKEFLKEWYPGLRGTGWYGSHKNQSPQGGGGYFGYWAFEAAAIAYLHGIDDAPFKDHLVYPKDLASFARSMPRLLPQTAEVPEKCRAGDACPRAGWWLTPAKENSRRRFEAGDIMPDAGGDYGATIWQWDLHQYS